MGSSKTNSGSKIKSIFNRLGQSGGFTLIELVIVIVVLGIVAAVAIPLFGDFTESAKIEATREEMGRLKKAILGDPSVTAGGKFVAKGYEGDVGSPPSTLVDLVVKPGSVAIYNKFSGLGWNGPYMDSTGGDYLIDAWGVAYGYDATTRTITSTGGPSPIALSF